MQEYISKVENVCQSLLNELNNSKGTNMKTKKDFFSYLLRVNQAEFVVEDMIYYFHGNGCTFTSKNLFLKWDFGYRSRWCGINPWKCATTFKENNIGNDDYYDGKEILKVCEAAVAEKKMFKKYEQYYFTIDKSETFVPEFPKEFDSLLIKHDGSKWLLRRDKVIDRFLRKVTFVSNDVEKDNNKYTLNFLHKEKKVYSIPYNDTGYPENAIRIMSDQIIKNLPN